MTDARREDDLRLAAACAAGDPAALAALSVAAARARAALGRMGLDAARRDEVIQDVLATVVAAEPGHRPAILGYDGRSSLGRWLEVVAVRAGMRLLRARDREPDRDDAFWGAVGTAGDDLELAYLKDALAPEVRAAAADAGAVLGARDRLLLRLRYGERASIDDVATRFDVHRATAARWIERAEQAYAIRLKGALLRRLRVRTAEAHSIVRLVMSRVGLSLGTLLGDGETLPDAAEEKVATSSGEPPQAGGRAPQRADPDRSQPDPEAPT